MEQRPAEEVNSVRFLSGRGFVYLNILGRNIFPVHVSISDSQLHNPRNDSSNSQTGDEEFSYPFSANNHHATVSL